MASGGRLAVHTWLEVSQLRDLGRRERRGSEGMLGWDECGMWLGKMLWLD